MGPGARLRERCSDVQVESLVVVDHAVFVDNATVSMARVFVDAQISHHDHVVTDFATQVTERQLHNALWVIGAATDRIFLGGDPEQDHRLHTESCQFGHFGTKRVTSVLHHTLERLDWLRLSNPLSHEQRRDQIIGPDMGLGQQITHRCGPAKSTRTDHRHTTSLGDTLRQTHPRNRDQITAPTLRDGLHFGLLGAGRCAGRGVTEGEVDSGASRHRAEPIRPVRE